MLTVDVAAQEKGSDCNTVHTVRLTESVGSKILSTNSKQKEQGNDLAGILNASIVGSESIRQRRKPFTRLLAVDLFTRFETEVSPSHAMTSQKREKAAFKSLKRLLGHLIAEEVTPHEAYTYRQAREAEGCGPGTVDYELRLLRQVFSTACRMWGSDYRRCSVLDLRKIKPRVPVGSGHALAESEIARLIEACAPELASVVTVALETGLRISELVLLTVEQIDFQRGTVTLEHQKNRKRSVLPLSQKALSHLQTSVNGRLRTDSASSVFLRRCGKAWTDSSLRQAFYTSLSSAGLGRYRFHDLRHTFATRLLNRGVPFWQVQALGRWSSATMLERYGHYQLEGLRGVLNGI